MYMEWPAEAGKELLLKKYSDLCELGVSVVKTTSENRFFSFLVAAPLR